MTDGPDTDPKRTSERTPGPLADGTLGGYLEHHSRPPAFEGPDGHPYTVSLEVEKTGDLIAPYSGYLVFPRWAGTGVGIVGHVESPLLLHGKSRDEVETALGALTLLEVKNLLHEAVRHRQEETDSC